MAKFNDELDDERKVAVGDIAEKLIRAADRIHDYHISIALGLDPPEGFEQGNKDYQQKILDLVSPMIKDYQQVKSITANTASSVIALLGKGKITPSEAITLLKVIQTKVETDEAEMALKLKKDLIRQLGKEDNDKLEIEG